MDLLERLEGPDLAVGVLHGGPDRPRDRHGLCEGCGVDAPLPVHRDRGEQRVVACLRGAVLSWHQDGGVLDRTGHETGAAAAARMEDAVHGPPHCHRAGRA